MAIVQFSFYPASVSLGRPNSTWDDSYEQLYRLGRSTDIDVPGEEVGSGCSTQANNLTYDVKLMFLSSAE